MSVGSRRAFLVALMIAVAALLVGASEPPLNPLVQRLPQPNRFVPPECAEGVVASGQPRIDVAELRDVPEPPTIAAQPVAPPSSDLRARLEELERAAANDDRTAFNAALRDVKDILNTYPAGGEKRAAQQKVERYEDVARLWQYQYESPTGAFIAEGSDLHAMLTAYPGYEDAVRRQVITDATGTRFYPTRESRAFLMRDIAPRARSSSASSRQTQTETSSRALPPVHPRSTSSPSRKPAPASTSASTSAKPTPRQQRSSPTRTKAAAPRVEHTSSTAAPPPARVPAAPSAAPPHTSAAFETPAPAAVDTAGTTTTVAPAVDTSATTVAPPPPAPATQTEAAPATTTSAAPATPAPQKESRSRNLVIPALLILVGLGVLIVLFRASS